MQVPLLPRSSAGTYSMPVSGTPAKPPRKAAGDVGAQPLCCGPQGRHSAGRAEAIPTQCTYISLAFCTYTPSSLRE
eukprot:gene13471-biopygen23047